MGIGDERAKDRTAFQHFKDEAQLLLAVKLFETGKLSIGQAAKLAGYSSALNYLARWVFLSTTQMKTWSRRLAFECFW